MNATDRVVMHARAVAMYLDADSEIEYVDDVDPILKHRPGLATLHEALRAALAELDTEPLVMFSDSPRPGPRPR